MGANVRSQWSDDQARAAASVDGSQLERLMAEAASVRDAVFGSTLTFSPKAFLPLTNLCRNRCDYCAFRRQPGDRGASTMTHRAVRDVVDVASRAGCLEALFCLGDQPETAFPSYRATLAQWGHDSTVDYLHWAGAQALERGLLPHTNAGVLSRAAMQRLKSVNVSLGLMLECTSDRLCQPGMPHHRAPDKRPKRRLAMLRQAGELAIPFTTGILVGAGETARERVETLLAIRALHREFGHIQEVIVQNFTPHPGTPMQSVPGPSDATMAHAVALARLILDRDVSLQAPPNLNPGRTELLVSSGLNDFGGVSPVTPDFINPDQPWPHLDQLRQECAHLGRALNPRLPLYDAYIERPGFLAPSLRRRTVEARARIAGGFAAWRATVVADSSWTLAREA